LGALVYGLLLEQIKNRGPTKMEGSAQIENEGPDLGATAGVALNTNTNKIACLIR
jgi:hypothetical protein